MSGEGGWVKIRNFPIFLCSKRDSLPQRSRGSGAGGGCTRNPPKTRGFAPKPPSSDPKTAQFGPQNCPVWCQPPQKFPVWSRPRGLGGTAGFPQGFGASGRGNWDFEKRNRWKSQTHPAGVGKHREKRRGNAGKTRGKKNGKTREKNGRKRRKKGKTTHREERGVGGEREFDAVVIKVGIAAGPGHPGGSRLEFMRENRGWNSDNFRLAGTERGSLTLSGASESRLKRGISRRDYPGISRDGGEDLSVPVDVPFFGKSWGSTCAPEPCSDPRGALGLLLIPLRFRFFRIPLGF